MKDEALKLALSCIRSSAEYKRGNATFIEAAEDVEQALAAPVQEPFGYVYEVYCLPECAWEMEWVESFDRYEPDAEENIRNVTPVYTTPPAAQRQWVGLTDEERKEIYNECQGVDVMKAITQTEAKLKEKNT